MNGFSSSRRWSVITAFLLGCAGQALAQGPSISGCPVLPADNVWNTPIDKLPVHSKSVTYVATIGTGKTMHADFGAGL